MKRNYLIISIICLIGAVSCDNVNDINYNQEYVIPVTKSVRTVDDAYTIRFDSVFTDSRCPEGAQCFWEGVAGARFTVYNKNLMLNTIELYTKSSINKQMNWSDSAICNGIKIQMLELSSYNSLISKSMYLNYKAKIKISKIN
jgi:hypothetical protein